MPTDSRWKILLTNDDGIAAPGLVALERAAASLGAETVVVAPAEPHSGCGHRVTTDRPLLLVQHAASRYSLAGTPADCVRVGLATVAAEAVMVLSGINAGGNLGVDIHHSGTVAAAREGALHGRRGVAASQYHRRGSEIDWERSAAWLINVLNLLRTAKDLPGTFWNINFPDLPAGAAAPPVVACAIDPSPFQLGYRESDAGWHYSASYHERPRLAGADVATCFGGAISLSSGRVV